MGEVHQVLFQKYRDSVDIYNVKMVNEIIFNRPVRITSIFKDYLVDDEISEFLKENYNHEQNKYEMKKLIDFFISYFKVFPNYVNIPERSFMYKNIERKQRIIDEKHYIIAQNKKLREIKEKRKMIRKTKLSKLPDNMDIFIEDNSFDSESGIQNKLFTPSYFNDITFFRHNFSGRKMSDESKQDVSDVEDEKAQPKVFTYIRKDQAPKPVILSRNIMEDAQHNLPKTKQENNKRDGWTKLMQFLEVSDSFKDTQHKDVSLSMTDHLQNDDKINTNSSSRFRPLELEQKYSHESNDSKERSTNVVSTLEIASPIKHTSTLEVEAETQKEDMIMNSPVLKITSLHQRPVQKVARKIRIIKNIKRPKHKASNSSFHGTSLKNLEKNQIQEEGILNSDLKKLIYIPDPTVNSKSQLSSKSFHQTGKIVAERSLPRIS